MKTVTVAALQRSWSDNTEENVQRAEDWIRIASAKGAQLILLPELFESPYFCKEQRSVHFDRAHPVKQHPTLLRMQQLARELAVVLPVSFFEQAGPVFFNSLAACCANFLLTDSLRALPAKTSIFTLSVMIFFLL